MAVASSHDDSDFPFDWLARSIRLVHHHIDGAPNGSGIRCRSALRALRELAREVRRLQDSRRDQIRRLRSQIAENDEDRALAVRTATLAERTRIAREIHDNVGHMLTRAIMQTEAAHVVAQVAGQEQSAQRFCEIHDTVSEAMTLVRKAVHDLKDEGTDFASQIETAAHSMDGAGPLRVRLVNGIDSVPAAVSRCFATAIREALNNTVKHSQARNVSITLRDFPALWQLCVQMMEP